MSITQEPLNIYFFSNTQYINHTPSMKAAILGKTPRDTLRGFHAISRNFSFCALRTATFERHHEVTTSPNAAMIKYHAPLPPLDPSRSLR